MYIKESNKVSLWVSLWVYTDNHYLSESESLINPRGNRLQPTVKEQDDNAIFMSSLFLFYTQVTHKHRHLQNHPHPNRWLESLELDLMRLQDSRLLSLEMVPNLSQITVTKKRTHKDYFSWWLSPQFLFSISIVCPQSSRACLAWNTAKI